MRPYWITTDKPMTLGYGVTAYSPEDAETLLRLVVPAEHAIIDITWVRDVQALDQGHVVSNMGNLFKRGMWYPLGYDHLTG